MGEVIKKPLSFLGRFSFNQRNLYHANAELSHTGLAELSDDPILSEVSVNVWVDCLMAIRTQQSSMRRAVTDCRSEGLTLFCK